MNSKQLQINRQWVAAFLLAGSILAAGLTEAGTKASGSTVQPTYAGQPRSQLRVVEDSKLGSGTDGVSFKGYESGLSSEFQHSFIARRKPGLGMGSSPAYNG